MFKQKIQNFIRKYREIRAIRESETKEQRKRKVHLKRDILDEHQFYIGQDWDKL